MTDAPTTVTKEPFWKMGFAVWFTTGAWVGFFPIMPGTVGAIWGLPLAWAMSGVNVGIQIVLIAVMVVAGIPVCTAAARRIGRKDPGCIVWDEIATVPMTFLFVAPGLMTNWRVMLIGFALHRVFDITKPPPAKRLESLPDGTGIMIDDCVAGVYSCVALHLVLRSGLIAI